MAENPDQAILELLKSIQAEIADLQRRMDAHLTEINARLTAIDKQHRRQWRDTAAMLVMMRIMPEDVEELVDEVEACMTDLEARRH